MHRGRSSLLLVLLSAALAACDHGLEPPEAPLTGVIVAKVGYENTWPPESSFQDLRFVAMRFVPRDTADFLQVNRLVFSDRMMYGVDGETVTVTDVETGPFFYAGVAQKYGPGTFNWQPIGLVSDNGGTFVVTPGETTHVRVTVDFANPPVFPPTDR